MLKISTKTKEILVGLIVTFLILGWPIWSAIAFVTTASITAWDKPYCIMVYNTEFHQRLNRVRNLANELYESRVDKARENISDPFERRKVRRRVEKRAWDEAGETIPSVNMYRSFSGWKDLWMPNLLNANKGHFTGSMNRSFYGSFYSILHVVENGNDKFYNWSHKRISFRDDMRSGNWGYPKGIECLPQKNYLIKKLFFSETEGNAP